MNPRPAGSTTSIAFVHNFCTHYTRALFESIAGRFDVQFLFFSRGEGRFWLREHGVASGRFRFRYLKGFSIAGTRITPSLVTRLLFGRSDVFVKCVNGRFALPVTYLCARLRGKPFVLYTGLWHRPAEGAQRWLFPLLRHIYRNADALVTYGEHGRRYLLTEGVAAARIFVAPHAVDNALYGRPVTREQIDAVRARLKVPAGARLILYLGRFSEEKGLEVLLEAARRTQAQDWVLGLVGAGPLRGPLERLIERDAGLAARVRIGGYVSPSATPEYYAAAWAAVLPSVATPACRELWGLVVNEVFNQGVPIVTTNVVGAVAGGLVREDRNGLVVAERDSAALAQALDQMLLEEGLRDRLGAAAREDVAGWTQERRADGFEQAIRYVLGEHRAGVALHAGRERELVP